MLTIGALGVVFGDIGTSPIYALRESLGASSPANQDVFGVVSLIFWSMMLVVSFKYILLVLCADDNGEGGILSLFALLPSKIRNASAGMRNVFVLVIILGTALLVADGMLTPANSVLSATEGIEAIKPGLGRCSIGITVLILVLLFGFQFKGTKAIGNIFGPIIFIWFVTIAVLGIEPITHHPEVIKSLSPIYAIEYISNHGWHIFVVLASVILAITGAEALYADLGHFGKKPIRISWFFIVAPALVLNYLGQAAVAIDNPKEQKSLFFALARTDGMKIYLVIIATLATIIASQALITGVASLAKQAINLKLLPPLNIVHTNILVPGQIYVPVINLLVGIGSILLVLYFKTSQALSHAYSFAMSTTMFVTTLAFAFVAADKLQWNKRKLLLIIPPILIVDLTFFMATITKILKGAWVPLLIGILIAGYMWYWRKKQLPLPIGNGLEQVS